MANYHYVANGQAQGPIPEAELDQLVSNGTLNNDPLVWTEGMPEWRPYSAVRQATSAPPQVALAAPTFEGGLVCSVCQQTFTADQVIRYGPNYVCGNCKPQFLQRLREGGQIGVGLEYARFGKRFLAKIVDTLIGYVIGLLLGLTSRVFTGGAPSVAGVIVVQMLGMAFGFAYPIFFLGKWGQTLGKMALGIKVVTPAGEKIGYGRATGRVFAEILSGLILGIGYLMVLWDAERRALHDMIAGTRVIIVRRS